SKEQLREINKFAERLNIEKIIIPEKLYQGLKHEAEFQPQIERMVVLPRPLAVKVDALKTLAETQAPEVNFSAQPAVLKIPELRLVSSDSTALSSETPALNSHNAQPQILSLSALSYPRREEFGLEASPKNDLEFR